MSSGLMVCEFRINHRQLLRWLIYLDGFGHVIVEDSKTGRKGDLRSFKDAELKSEGELYIDRYVVEEFTIEIHPLLFLVDHLDQELTFKKMAYPQDAEGRVFQTLRYDRLEGPLCSFQFDPNDGRSPFECTYPIGFMPYLVLCQPKIVTREPRPEGLWIRYTIMQSRRREVYTSMKAAVYGQWRYENGSFDKIEQGRYREYKASAALELI